MADRPKVSKKSKDETLASGRCYVCEDLNLVHSDFSGYESGWVHFDHYRLAIATVGSAADGNPYDTMPIHAAPGGDTPDDPDYEKSLRRNCHQFRGAEFGSRNDYVRVIRARLGSRDAVFVDDVGANRTRDSQNSQFHIPLTWSELTAKFAGDDYRLVEEQRGGEVWQRFLTSLPPRLLFTDHQSQVRPATKKVLHKMISTYLVEGYPTFAPINARVDACGHVVVFDGNHRATSFALSFGLDNPVPVMIWKIEHGDRCALEGLT